MLNLTGWNHKKQFSRDQSNLGRLGRFWMNEQLYWPIFVFTHMDINALTPSKSVELHFDENPDKYSLVLKSLSVCLDNKYLKIFCFSIFMTFFISFYIHKKVFGMRDIFGKHGRVMGLFMCMCVCVLVALYA